MTMLLNNFCLGHDCFSSVRMRTKRCYREPSDFVSTCLVFCKIYCNILQEKQILVSAGDLKSRDAQASCGFDPHPRHHRINHLHTYGENRRGADQGLGERWANGNPFEQAVADLEAAVTRHQFGVLHVHDLAATLRGKGIDFVEECKILEVCNPGQASKVLAADMRLNMALPCRISVFTERGRTRIGLVTPSAMLGALSDDPALVSVAQEVEVATKAMVDEAR